MAEVVGAKLLLYLLGLFFCGKVICTEVTFRCSYSTTRVFQNSSEADSFHRFFSQKDKALRILSLNPGLDKVEKISDNLYRGYLSPITFPGLSMTTVIDFDVETVQKDRLVAKVDRGSITQKYKGLKFLVDVFSKLPSSEVESSSTTIFERKNKTLRNSADLKVYVTLPSWFPFPLASITESGTLTVQKKIMKDVDKFMGNMIRASAVWGTHRPKTKFELLVSDIRGDILKKRYLVKNCYKNYADRIEMYRNKIKQYKTYVVQCFR